MLNFPNHSRSYDADRGRIRFWGYDSAMEVPFFIENAAVLKLYPRTQNLEREILAAFDAGRARIYAAASRVYSRGRDPAFFILVASDF